jgi:hypothetical protein
MTKPQEPVALSVTPDTLEQQQRDLKLAFIAEHYETLAKQAAKSSALTPNISPSWSIGVTGSIPTAW